MNHPHPELPMPTAADLQTYAWAVEKLVAGDTSFSFEHATGIAAAVGKTEADLHRDIRAGLVAMRKAAPASTVDAIDPNAPPTRTLRKPPSEDFWPATMPPFIAVHEATHAVCARHLGLQVEGVVADPDLGFCSFSYPADSPPCIAAAAVATAAAPIFHDMCGLSLVQCRDDLTGVAALCAKYRALTGEELKVWSFAREVLKDRAVGDAILKLAGSLTIGVIMRGPEIEALLGPVPTAAASDPTP